MQRLLFIASICICLVAVGQRGAGQVMLAGVGEGPVARAALLEEGAPVVAAGSRARPVAAAGSRARLGGVARVFVTSVTGSSVRLRWSETAGAARYDVRRGGRIIIRVRGTSVLDRSVAQLSSYEYRVRAVAGDGSVGPWSRAAPITTNSAGGCHRVADSAAGSDGNPGTAAAPVRSVRRLLQRMSAGQVGCLRGRFAEDVTIRQGGSAAAPIVLRSVAGTRATIRGRMWIADGADHVVLERLRIDGRNLDNGDLPSPTIQGDFVRLLGNDITNRRWAICVILGSVRGYGQARSVTLDRNRIHDCGKRPANNHHHAVYLENAVGTRITNNVILQSADRGIQLYPSAQRSYIARNAIVANGQGVIFSGNHGYASSDNRVVDNVITHARLRYNVEHWWPAGNPVGRNNLAARNCLFAGDDGELSTPQVGYVARGNRIANPRYRNLRAGDLRPRSGSGCRHLLGGVLPLRPIP